MPVIKKTTLKYGDGMRTRLGLIACLALTLTCCQCSSEVQRGESSELQGDKVTTNTVRRGQTRQANRELQAKFAQLLRRWDKHLKSPQVRLSARPHEHLNCEAYRAIVRLGKDALPLIIEEMRRGNNLLFFAVNDITGLTVNDVQKELQAKGILPDESIRNITTLYLLWWDMKASEPEGQTPSSPKEIADPFGPDS